MISEEDTSDSEVFMNKELKKALQKGSSQRYRECLAHRDNSQKYTMNIKELDEPSQVASTDALSRQLRHRPILKKIINIKGGSHSRSSSLKKFGNHAVLINLTMPDRIVENESIAQIEARNTRKKV